MPDNSNPPNVVICPACGQRMRAITAAHYRKHGCDTAAMFKKKYNITSLVCAEKRRAHSKAMTKNNPMAGQKHSDTALEKMRVNRRGKGISVAGKYERTPAIRAKISCGVVQAMKDGRHSRGEWFFCEKADGEVWTRSSWERRVLRVLDLHPCVEEVQVEPFAIPYEFEDLEGEIRELWEIKPHELMIGDSESARKNRAKQRALNNYVRQHHMNGRWVPLDQILGMEMQVGIRPWVGSGRPWVDLNNPDARPTTGVHYGEAR